MKKNLIHTPWGMDFASPRKLAEMGRRMAGIHPEPRRAEAQPGAVARTPGPGQGFLPDAGLRRGGLRGTHRQDASGHREAIRDRE